VNRYYLSSAAIHFSLVGLLLWAPWIKRSNALFIDGFDYYGDGGGGGGGGGKVGPKAETMGQVVPQPVKIPVPAKPAPVQQAERAEEVWNTKNKVKVQPTPAKETPREISVHVGEKTQKETSNVVSLGKKEGETAGTGFDYGGEGPGSGPGVGIGIGPGEGGGSGGGFGGGYGSYLGIMRRRIWSEWTQSAVYGTDRMCVVGLTVARNGNISQIKLEKGSGNADYDNVALRAVRNASPLPPLPVGFSGSEQRFKIAFRLLE
jgi:TonB family protein